MGHTWKRLAESSQEFVHGHTCDTLIADTPGGGRCGRSASWESEAVCVCGGTHDAIYICHDHRVSDLEQRLVSERAHLIRALRVLNTDLRTDGEAFLYAHGILVSSRPAPDAFWYNHNVPNRPGAS